MLGFGPTASLPIADDGVGASSNEPPFSFSDVSGGNRFKSSISGGRLTGTSTGGAPIVQSE